MSEFFLEVFTEEIPAKLQSSARNNLLKLFRDFFESESIETHGKEKAYSTPNRLIIHFDKIKKAWNDHTVPIKKFGRYPHRNKILKRESTIEEIDFLKQPNTSW